MGVTGERLAFQVKTPVTGQASRISVIIPVFQGERYVRGAIVSALNQTHENVEILAIDDGSTDGTWLELQSFQRDGVQIFRQQNSGAAAARNFGLTKATGNYIAFLDADDRWLPRKLQTELSTLQCREDSVGIAYSWYYAIDKDGTLLHLSKALSYSGNVFEDLLKGSSFILPSASLFHREIFDTLGGFNANRRHHEDFEFVLRASRKYPAYPTNQYLVLYTQSLSGKGRSVMRDYEVAVEAALSVGDDLCDVLSEVELQQLQHSQLRALYFRFLMYGFNSSAARLLQEIPTASLRSGAKGWLGWVFAMTNVNLMLPARMLAQRVSRTYPRAELRRYREMLRDMTFFDRRRSESAPASHGFRIG